MAVADAAAAAAADVVTTPPSYWSGVGIVALSAVLALAMEAFTWAMVYRKEEYQAAKARVKVLAERLAREEATIEPAHRRKAQEKRLAGLTEDLKTASSALSSPTRTGVSLTTSAVLFLAYRFLSSAYAGTVVARLPFAAPPFFHGMTRRGLGDGGDATDASFAFVYAVATMALKGNMQRALGFTPPRGAYDALKASRKMAEEHAEKQS
ncbi:hypothetical protein BU14_0187s0008 [Porphyra umbilicalis]|uniref:Calcium load-activated calcium channel n=1 Tax=Porphyra umbilicalis TaxID=2786 RepID=A0A1X6P6J7_PORUM|nr:hypothetical protein BU14_0187s0008 [Porphyra umbilicalis]|eukprot:OSX76529.1 hypothetical protein BU14_0187s0008 [Porphyra umbilicalis]